MLKRLFSCQVGDIIVQCDGWLVATVRVLLSIEVASDVRLVDHREIDCSIIEACLRALDAQIKKGVQMISVDEDVGRIWAQHVVWVYDLVQ